MHRGPGAAYAIRRRLRCTLLPTKPIKSDLEWKPNMAGSLHHYSEVPTHLCSETLSACLFILQVNVRFLTLGPAPPYRYETSRND